MKRWMWILGAILALQISGSRGRSLEQLEPAELLYAGMENGIVILKTDTGAEGTGKTVSEAVTDMQKNTPGIVFLETAEQLVVHKKAEELLGDLPSYLRPGTEVCLTDGDPDPENAAAYLRIHSPSLELKDLRGADAQLPILKVEGDRYYLVDQDTD